MPDMRLIQEARAILADETPLEFDCGTLCGHRCCTDFDSTAEEGVYLLPGELPCFDGTEDWTRWRFHATADYEFAPSWSHHRRIPFLMCSKLCQREKRPFECRTYPLLPYLHEDGTLEMRYSPWAESICPLLERYQVDELRPAFVAAAKRAWEVLLQDEEMQDHVRWLAPQMKAWAELPHTSREDDDLVE